MANKILVTLALTLMTCLASSCTHRVYVPVESVSVRRDTVREMSVRVDSVTLRDSVAVYVKGDSVTITRWRDRERVRLVHDTVSKIVEKVDSIKVPVPVERNLSRWERTKMVTGGLVLGSIIALLVVMVRRVIRRPKI